MVIVTELFPQKNGTVWVFFILLPQVGFCGGSMCLWFLMGFDAFDVVGPYIELDLFKNDNFLMFTMVTHH